MAEILFLCGARFLLGSLNRLNLEPFQSINYKIENNFTPFKHSFF